MLICHQSILVAPLPTVEIGMAVAVGTGVAASATAAWLASPEALAAVLAASALAAVLAVAALAAVLAVSALAAVLAVSALAAVLAVSALAAVPCEPLSAGAVPHATMKANATSSISQRNVPAFCCPIVRAERREARSLCEPIHCSFEPLPRGPACRDVVPL